jgi:hypothetical protein
MINEQGLVAHYTKSEILLEKILVDTTIKFGPINELDDPRESDLGWLDTEGIGWDIDIEGSRIAREKIESLGQRLRLFCTAMPKNTEPGACPIETSIYGRPRMWAQYGEKFMGGCVLFDYARLDDAIKTFCEANGDYLDSGAVEYHSWLHGVSGGATISYGGASQPSEVDMVNLINENNILHSIYFKKGMDWTDEVEYRWLMLTSSAEGKYVKFGNAIHSVVLGTRFPVDKYDEAKEKCKSLNVPCYLFVYRHPEYELIQF